MRSYLLDETDRDPAKAAIGRMLTDYRALHPFGNLNGLELQFETVRVKLNVIDELVFTIDWERA